MDAGPYHLSQMREDQIQNLLKDFNFSKREFMTELFNEYNNLPFSKCLKSFANVFNDMFLNEIPTGKVKYQLMEMQICEISQMGTSAENFEIVFKHNFFR